MTTAPVADQHRLLEVQALDTRLQQLVHRRTNLPGHAIVTDLVSRLEDVESALVTSRTAAGDLRRELAKAEGDVEQVRARAARDQARMDSGSASAKDLQALTSELTALGRRQAELEDVELAIMERLESHETALAGLTTARDGVLEHTEQARSALAREVAAIDEEIAAVQTERESLSQGLDAGLVALYDRLRESSGGLGVALLRGRRCEGCRLELNPSDVAKMMSAPVDQVVRCEECSRILVRAADPAR
ncbi:zinc ribbon domain-containing protein [Actinotalea sp. K2]|uniref:zinc ribbon domain-containing protein n=1 Tax=Actinotalea sp. K2 TaxID=2939438 RepID=UPI002017E36F|nr:C4-type zinc ribbon domain-containing protein [Actinotalea sp. K2]MCL3860678.1 C4-type zinc ribbon domain-containing protein [Actinotalea sp. K2]